LREAPDVVVEASPGERRIILNRLSLIAAKLACGDIVVPPSASPQSIGALSIEGRKDNGIRIGKNASSDFIVTSARIEGVEAGHFAMLSPSQLVLTAGVLTDRGVEQDWPQLWHDYGDCKGKRVLDHCCGGGAKVGALRALGVDAHGVDICTWGSNIPEFLHYGKAENLPFVDGAFDRVESRMGVLLWSQDNKQTCREALAEMIRVTADGGVIRIASVREGLLRTLVSERPDLFFAERQLPDYGAFELIVRRKAE
jgi:SAM-dependent methyltransferase